MKMLVYASAAPFVLGLLIFGIVTFRQIDQWGHAYDAKMAQIERGEVPAETLTLLRKDRSDPDSNSYLAVFRTPRESELKMPVNADYFASAQPGETVTGYYFRPDGYLVPALHRGGHHTGKWIFLGLSIGGAAVVTALVYFGTRRMGITQATGVA
jgi:hypothetical protein